MKQKNHFLDGLRDGIPICLGYLAVSFTFGIMAKKVGVTVFQAVLISLTNLTSAGQFAGLTCIQAMSSYTEIVLTQIVINLRYCLMSCSLSQKFDSKMPYYHRFLIAYGVTDEIFGVSSGYKGKLPPSYSYGLILISTFGWVFGTFLGIVSGNILPARAISALSVALYGMFIAIIIPPARDNKVILGIIIAAMTTSLLFEKLPYLSMISSGFRIIIITVAISAIAAYFFPVEDEEGGTESES